MIWAIIILFLIYIAMGIYRIVSDSRLSFMDQPDYIRHPKLGMYLFVVMLWPISDIDFFVRAIQVNGIRGFLREWQEDRKRMKISRIIGKLERMRKKMTPSELLLSEKYNRLSKEVKELLEEIKKEKQGEEDLSKEIK